jgi:polyisoprenoid-binding protein YceI
MSVSTTASNLTGTWAIDRSHSAVEFSVKHMVISNVKGRFRTFSGALVVDEADPARSSVEVEIDAASVDTHDEQRDAHLRSADFFDVERHPTLSFRSTAIRPLGGDRFEVIGDLTIRGSTQPVTLAAELLGQTRDPWGGIRAGFSASASIDRRAYGLTWNSALEVGGVLVGDQVRISLEIELIKS